MDKNIINLVDKIDIANKTITDKVKISNRVGKLCTKESYVLIKDHTADFETKLPTSIINRTRTEIERISKVILDEVNKKD